MAAMKRRKRRGRLRNVVARVDKVFKGTSGAIVGIVSKLTLSSGETLKEYNLPATDEPLRRREKRRHR